MCFSVYWFVQEHRAETNPLEDSRHLTEIGKRWYVYRLCLYFIDVFLKMICS